MLSDPEFWHVYTGRYHNFELLSGYRVVKPPFVLVMITLFGQEMDTRIMN